MKLQEIEKSLLIYCPLQHWPVHYINMYAEFRHQILFKVDLIVISGFVSGQQQYFRVPPSDQEVGEGGTVDIPCEVGNRRGRVQWTKDGLTLGKTLLPF